MPNPSRVTTITDSAQHLQQPSGLFQLVTPKTTALNCPNDFAKAPG